MKNDAHLYKGRVALVTGITGQDGSYLAEILLDKGYIVWGLTRRSSDINTHRIDHLYSNKNLVLRYGDMTDGPNLIYILSELKKQHPEMTRLEIYNLAAMSHVKVSFSMPEYVANCDGVGVLRLLEAVRCCDLAAITKFYQASTSELYGLVQEVPQKETTPFYPRSPYGVAKLYGYWIVKNYREAYGMHASNGILFNHESPRRGPTFVTRKITRGLNMLITGERDVLTMGNIDAKRDWGHAKDYAYGMWLVLQQAESDDYVLATNEFHSVREFIEKSFALRGFELAWDGSGLEEIGYDVKTDRKLIDISERYFRPAEVEELLGDSTKAREKLGWNCLYSFDDLIKEMVDHDCPE
jgi:GDPmannose 4,6-dehydratase